MDIYTCANHTCNIIFTPTEDPRQKYCSKTCKRAVEDQRAEQRSASINALRPYTRDWRDSVQPQTKVYLDQNTTIVFSIIFAERGIAWIRPAIIKESHECLDDSGRCWCEGEKLVTLSRCDLANTKTQKRAA